MNVKVLDESLLREVFQAPGAAGVARKKKEEEEEREKHKHLEHLVGEKILSELRARSKNARLSETVSTAERFLHFINAMKREREELSRVLEHVQLELAQASDLLEDEVQLVSALKEEEEEDRSMTGMLSLPEDVWMPFLGGEISSNSTAKDPFSEDMARSLWGEDAIEEVKSCSVKKSRLATLLRLVVQQHERMVEIAALRRLVCDTEREMVLKLELADYSQAKHAENAHGD